jgi:hypothetical protein
MLTSSSPGQFAMYFFAEFLWMAAFVFGKRIAPICLQKSNIEYLF